MQKNYIPSKGLHIIMYHYVRDFSKTNYKNIKGVDVKNFETQIKKIKNTFNILEPKDVHYTIRNKLSFGEFDCWLTFDDGLKDHILYVLPILDKYDLKGSFYPPTITTMGQKILDVHKIQHIISINEDSNEIIKRIKNLYEKYTNKNHLLFSELVSKIDLNSRYDDTNIVLIKRLLQRDIELEIREKICDNLFNDIVTNDKSEFIKSLYMDSNDLLKLYSLNHEIGSHGYDHFHLSYLSRSIQEQEIRKSIDYLRNLNLLRDDWSMCYPYGDYNTDSLDILNNLNCNIGLTTIPKENDRLNYANLELTRWDTNDFL